MIATTIEQSDRLLACRVDPETADMFYTNYRTKPNDGVPIVKTVSLGIRKDLIPAWSLSALLELLPKEIDIDGYPYRISIYFENTDEPVIGNKWCLYYKPKKHNERSRIDDVPMYASDLIECAVLMIEWLHNQDYKLNQEQI